MCTNERLSDKKLFPTFARTIPPVSGLASPVRTLLMYFNWSRVGIIAEGNGDWPLRLKALENSFKEGGVTIAILRAIENGVHYNATHLQSRFDKILWDTAGESRGNLLLLRFFSNDLINQNQSLYPCIEN